MRVMNWKRYINNHFGLTLIELLAVIVILGIIALIAILSVTKVIDTSRKHAIVSNAYAMRDAGNLYAKEKMLEGQSISHQNISYQELLTTRFLEQITDPDTREEWSDSNSSFVTIEEERVVAVCIKGEERNLCYDDDGTEGILIDDLGTDKIKENE